METVERSVASGAEPLNIAIIGAGNMAQHHARAILRLAPRARLTAFVDPSPEAQKAMRAIVPDARTHDDIESLLAAGRPDVVHIVTPPAMHARLARVAIEAGCHVYVEKPFVETSSEAEALLELAAAKDLKVCAGHQLLYEPPTREARNYLPALGRLVHIESYFSFRTVRRAPGGRAPLRPDQQLLDILPHPTYLLLAALEAAPGEGSVNLASLEIGPAGTVHALVKRGGLTCALTVTLEGRPIESYLRLTGTNGTLCADYVRGTMQRHVGPGTSGIDKLIAPYRQGWQLLVGTTVSLARRVLNRQRSYPGLMELFDAFYNAIRSGAPSPVSPVNILETVRICERVAEALQAFQERLLEAQASVKPPVGPRVVVTGGTGLLGKAVAARLLEAGYEVVAIARREPPAWERTPGVAYAVTDLGGPLAPTYFDGAMAVVHTAAETAGGWEEHQRNSIDATRHVIEAAAAAKIKRLVHVSSVAVLEKPLDNGPIRDDSALIADSRGSGPYIWGKLESERLALALGRERGVEVRVVRPGAIVDYADFDPPGRLGKRLGNLFVAVGSPSERLGVVSLDFCARTMAWLVGHWDETASPINLLDPQLPTKREMLKRLRRQNPDLTVVWLPNAVLRPLSWAALALQQWLRPGKPPIDVARVFAVQPFDNASSAELASRLHSVSREGLAQRRLSCACGSAADPAQHWTPTRMNILWLSHLVPYPPTGLGVLQRSYNLVRELARTHRVYLLAFVQRKLLRDVSSDPNRCLEDAYAHLRSYCSEVAFLPIPSEQGHFSLRLALGSLCTRTPYTINWLESREMRDVACQWRERYDFDLVHFDTISLSTYLDIFAGYPLTLDHHNIESHMMLRRAEQEPNLLRRAYFWQEGQRLTAYERRVLPRFDLHLTCSSLDTERLNELAPGVAATEIPNGVDVDYFTPDRSKEMANELIFAGNLTWYPNAAAMIYFAEQIWPILRAAKPEVVMHVVGANPPVALQALAARDTQFKVHGFVPDVRTFLNKAAAYVCPIMDGGGTRLKILDALAMGKPLVAHPVAAEGLQVVEGETVLYAREPQEYVRHITLLLEDANRRARMGAAARRLAEQAYSYASIGRRLSEVLQQCCDTARRARPAMTAGDPAIGGW